MPHNHESILQIIMLALVSVIAGALDYLHSVQLGRRVWHFCAFILHLCLALFTGTLAVMAVTELGYSIHAAGASAGAAGFLNVRLFNIVEVKLQHWSRKK